MCNNNFFSQKQGFSLLEIMLYVALVGIIGLTLFSLLSLVIDIRTKQLVVEEVEGQGIVLTQLLNTYMRSATAVTAPAANTSGTTLTLSQEGDAAAPRSIFLQGTTLMIQEQGKAPLPLTSNRVQCTSFVARQVSALGSPTAVQVSFTLASLNQVKSMYSYSRPFTTSVTLRLW